MPDIRIWIIMFWWGASSIGYAQQPHFVQHEISESFVNAQVNLIYQDKNCLIWLGTTDGLISYNGFDMRRPEGFDTLRKRSVTAIFEDSRQRMWIGFDHGAIYQLEEGKVLRPVVFDEGWPAVRITGFAQDSSNKIWISTYGEGVYCFDGTHLYNLNTDDGMLGDDVYCLEVDDTGSIWCGTDGGINICAFENQTKQIKSLTVEDGLPDQIIKEICKDIAGNMWIGTYDAGICYYDLDRDSVYHYLVHPDLGPVNTLSVFDHLDVWIGTGGAGLWRYDLNTHQLKQVGIQDAPTDGRVNDLYKDVEGNLWVISNVNDIHSAFRQFETATVDCGDIQALYMCSDDLLWVGTNQGLYTAASHIDKTSAPERHLTSLDLNVTAIVQDSFDNIWIGTLDKGIFIYQPGTRSYLRLHRGNGLVNNSIMSFDQSENALWIGTLGGVGKYDLSANIMDQASPGKSIQAIPELSASFLYHVYVDRDGNPWFATDGDGVFVLREGSVKQHTGTDSIPLKTVYSITQDHRGHIWMSTPDEGLVEFDGSHYSRLGLHDGLSNLSILSLVTDHRGDIMIVYTDGIDVMKPAERHFMYFNDEIGIEKLDPGLNATCIDRFNTVWIGSKDLVIRHPALFEQLSIHPRTQLKEVSIFLEPINYYAQSRFNHNQNYFSFDYVGLWYTSPTSVKYLYKLDGYDINWKESKDHFASYSNLGPGDYTFMVKASENKFFHDEPIAEYSFTIDKPFWAKIWFIALVILFVGGCIYLFMRFREKRSERQALLKKERIESQFLALKAQINPHFLFNSFNTLITIIDENPDLAVEYVENLSDFYRSILQFREKETISLEEEIDVVRSYWFLLKKRFGDNLKIHVDVNGLKSSIPPLTLQMLVENAVKHNIISKSKPLNIEITANGDKYIVVRNNKQTKLSPVPSTNFGLQSIINRYQLLTDRKVIIEDQETFFTVRIPTLKKEH